MLSTLSRTRLLHLTALLCVGAVGIALISQYGFDMRPCAWCVFQRLIYLVIALVCWLTLAGRRSVIAHLGVLLVPLLAIGGAVTAWYQYDVASAMLSCDLSFADRFMVQSGLDANVSWLFGIQAACFDAKVDLLGVEYALWSLILFLVITLLGILAVSGNAKTLSK